MKKTNYIYLILMIISIFSISSAALAVQDDMYTDWVEDIQYILKLDSIEKAEKWLSLSYSGYECEKEEETEVNVCKKNYPVESLFECSISIHDLEPNSAALTSGCVIDKKIETNDFYEELTEMITESQDKYISVDGLKIQEEEWDEIVNNLYEMHKKSSKFNYWLFGENIVTAGIATDKETETSTIYIERFPARIYLEYIPE